MLLISLEHHTFLTSSKLAGQKRHYDRSRPRVHKSEPRAPRRLAAPNKATRLEKPVGVNNF
jgi:hypothetical protein